MYEIVSYRQVEMGSYMHETAEAVSQTVEAVSQTAVQQWRLTHSIRWRSDGLGSALSAMLLSQILPSSGRADYSKPRLTARKPRTTRKLKRTTKTVFPLFKAWGP